ncbi:transposase [Pseudomonas sp.]|uniref:REP-associated tyrosine transposase n=1 Tax=Pseudomonas sp. TaxID=306 RepID=UPI002733BA1D|nr:transposase [Pseudomonas sp.]MDP3816655.1 transposase [Pseudomonas sp.]
MHYRRAWIPGGTHFFTVTLADRSQTLLTDHIQLLRQSVRDVRLRHPFSILAMVVMPEHLHAIWQLPQGDSAYSTRWMLIKSSFSRALIPTEPISLSRHLKRERGVWQRRYWEHCIRDSDDLKRHVDYIHFNPVKHAHVERPIDWPYSSIHRYIRQGVLPADWAGEAQDRRS